MTPQESLDRVAELLAGLPSTTVDKHWRAEGIAHVYLRTQSLDSLAVIVQHATFANAKSVEVHFVGPPARDSPSSEAHKLQFRLTLASNDDDGDPPTTVQIFGIYLVRHLKATGLMPPEYADDLQKQWNAALM